MIFFFQIQEDIATLRLVLNDKIKRENELKTLLGVSVLDEIKQDFAEGFNQIKSTSAYVKTYLSLFSFSRFQFKKKTWNFESLI